MKKQFHVEINGKDGLVVDLSENDVINLRVGNSSAKYQKNNPPNFQVDGTRWSDEQCFELSWANHKLKIGDEILVKYMESDKAPTAPTREKIYREPEASCSFCNKTKSEVKYLVERDSSSRICICDECTEVSARVIAEHDSAI